MSIYRNFKWMISLIFYIVIILLFTLNCYADDNPPPQDFKSYKGEGGGGGVGGGSGTVTPDLFTGTMSYSIPIEVPEGRKGMSPGLSLDYRSNSGNGWVGVGWDLEVGAIERSTRNGIDYSGNNYVLRMAGATIELVFDQAASFYRSKIEGAFYKIEKLTSSDGFYWQATDKKGTRYIFGKTNAVTTGSRQENPAGQPSDPNYKIFKWCLERIEDTNGNFMDYHYVKLDGQIYIDSIEYTGNSVTQEGGTNFVRFYRELRNDAPAMFSTKFEVTTSYRLKTIAVQGNGTLVRAYKLEYDADQNTFGSQYSLSTTRSLLTSIQQFGKDATFGPDWTITGGTAMPATIFNWQTPMTGFRGGIPAGFDANRDHRNLLSADINGDGKSDFIVQFDTYADGAVCGPGQIQAYISNGDGTFHTPSSCPGIDANRDYRNLLVGDINGDGKSDLIMQANSGGSACGVGQTSVYLSNGDGTFQPVICPGIDANRDYRNLLVADIDGDGKSDLIMQANSGGSACGAGQTSVYLSNGDGTFKPVICPGIDANRDYRNLLVADIDGDGKSDLIMQANSGGSACGAGQIAVYISNGDGTFKPVQCPGIDANRDYRNLWVADVNGDGIADLIYQPNSGGATCGAGQVAVYIGNGDATFQPVKCPGFDANRDYRNLLVADVNGDGRSDLIVQANSGGSACGPGQIAVHISNGDGTFQPVRCPGIDANRDYRNLLVADVDGDGKPDLIYQPNSGGATFGPGQVGLYMTNKPAPDLLTSILNGIGGSTTIAYQPSTVYVNTLLPFAVQTVSSVVSCDNYDIGTICNGNSSTTNYSYYGGYYHIGDHDFRGFNKVTVTTIAPNGQPKITVMSFHQGNNVAIDENTPSDHYGYMKGKLYRTMVKDGQGKIYANTTMSYLASDPTHTYYFTPPAQVDTYSCDGGSSVCDASGYGRHTQSTSYYNAGDDLKYGNVSREELHGGDSDGSTDRTIRHIYIYNPNLWIVGLPASDEVYKGIGVIDGNKISASYFIYDETAACDSPTVTQNQTQSPTPTRGNLSRIVRLYKEKNINDPDPEVHMTYDQYGNLVCTRDVKGNTSTLSYDNTNTFPAIATIAANSPLALQASTQYYTGTISDKGLYGQVKSITDANGNVTTMEYDKLGRKTKVISADGTPDASWTSWTYPQLSDYGHVGIQKVLVNNSEGLKSWTYFDGLGRTMLQKKDGPANKVIAVKTDYNNTGVVRQTSMPYFEGDQALYTSYIYDFPGRAIQVNNPDFTTVKACFNEGVSIGVDANGHSKRTTMDGLGRLVKVEEYIGTFSSCSNPGSLYATTIYQYDVLGHLLTVTDNSNNTISMTYDSLGRKITMHDPDMGNWTYAYDLNGNLTKQVDAKGQLDGKAIFFSYDDLNRVKFKDYPALGTHIVTYLYDETWSENAKSRVTSISDAAGTSTKYYYDPMGRTKKVTKHMDSSDYTLQYAYDGLGRLKYLTYPYPDNDVVKYDYNTDGSLFHVINNGTGANYATYTGYNALGQPGNVAFGNGVATAYTYRLDNNRLDTIFTDNGSQNLLVQSYGYDNVGNITFITDNTPGRPAAPHFDEVASYDYTINHYQPHAVQHNLVTGTTYTYDPNGNMTADGTRSMSYNYDNMPTSITVGSSATTFVYDGSGSRVKKITPSSTTTYIGKLYECSGSSCAKYIYAGGERIAHKVGASNIVYYHSDHLGSTSAMSDATGAKIEDIQYLPFGETRLDYGSVSMAHKYTSQEFDAETSLYYYNARYYNPALGRFISADTIVPSPSNPQALNRYSYVFNNPLNYNDPTGHWRVSISAHYFVGGDISYDSHDGRVRAGVGGGMGGGASFGNGSWSVGASADRYVDYGYDNKLESHYVEAAYYNQVTIGGMKGGYGGSATYYTKYSKYQVGAGYGNGLIGINAGYSTFGNGGWSVGGGAFQIGANYDIGSKNWSYSYSIDVNELKEAYEKGVQSRQCNGCGAENGNKIFNSIIDFLGTTMTGFEGCDTHDSGYGTLGSDKASVDFNLGVDMAKGALSNLFERNGPLKTAVGLVLSPVYYFAVSVGGGSAYSDAQLNARAALVDAPRW